MPKHKNEFSDELDEITARLEANPNQFTEDDLLIINYCLGLEQQPVSRVRQSHLSCYCRYASGSWRKVQIIFASKKIKVCKRMPALHEKMLNKVPDMDWRKFRKKENALSFIRDFWTDLEVCGKEMNF